MSSSPWGAAARWVLLAWRTIGRLLGVVRSDLWLAAFAAALLLADLFWIGYFGVGRGLFELGRGAALYNRKELLITTDGGFPEWFNYVKMLLLLVLLIRLARTSRQWIYLALATLFVVILLDDAMQIHEALGKFFVSRLDIEATFGLRKQDIGEVIAWAIMGLVLMPSIAAGLERTSQRHRGNGLAFLAAFGLLVFSAVFVDQLYHSGKRLFLLAGVLIDMIEDGGEMLATTLAVCLALGAERERKTLPDEPPVGRFARDPTAVWQPTRTQVVWLTVVVFCFGLATAVFVHWEALVHPAVYKQDIIQSPHWAAYHSTSFQPDDLILRYASHNESPLQNAIYWIGTWFIDFVSLTKLLAVLSFGALGALFFLVGRAMYGARCGLLLVLFTLWFSGAWEFSAGFFSKFWAIPLLLVCVYLLHTERWRWFVALLPFGALAYPTLAVLLGLTVSVYMVQEWFRDRSRAVVLFRYLAIGSALALALLMVKYAAPPEFIGPMRAGSELREMPEVQADGYPSNYVPIPTLYEELVLRVGPFTLLCALVYFLVLRRTGIAWERSWTALFVASAIGYMLADLLFMRFYVPNRYTRYSMIVLIALWNARNFDLLLARIHWNGTRIACVAGLLLVGGYFQLGWFLTGPGWSDRRYVAPVSEFIRDELPEGILIAGSPKRLDDVMTQARRSVLVPYKLAHPWFVDYYDEISERTRATLRAHFAADARPLNELHRRYGVTHFLVEKSLFRRMNRGRLLYAQPYSDEIYTDVGRRRRFFLIDNRRLKFLWEDERHAILELPVR